MASYIISKEITITRQEGDTADLEITVPSVFNMATFDVYFQVFTYAKTLLFKKELTDWVIDGQNITADISPTDTKGNAGKHRWELEIDNGTKKYTIGCGNFIITKELIK